MSSIFKVEVKIFTVSAKQLVLQCTSYNGNYEKAVRLLKSKDTHFDAVFADDMFAGLGFCQNIVLNLINRVLTGDSQEWRDLNKGKYVNIEYEVGPGNSKQWKKISQEPTSPKREQSANRQQTTQPKEDQKSMHSLADTQKKMHRQEANSREKTYSIFKTDAKKEHGKDREYFQNFNSVNPLKKLQSKTERKEGSVLADIENNVNLKIQEADGTNSDSFHLAGSTSNKNSSSFHNSPENPMKRLEAFDRELSIGEMQ